VSATFIHQIEIFAKEHASPEAVSRAIAKAAREGTAELIATGRASPRFTRYVDGREGVAPEAVRPNGVIVDVFETVGEIIGFALGFLQKRAPGDDFREGFFLGLDGKMVAASAFNPNTLGSVQTVFIGNSMPYNRLVDVQLAGTQKVRWSVPDDMYQDCAQAIGRRFGNVVNAYREYNIDFPNKYRLRTGPRRGKPVQSPALVMEVRR
jgi:hypothetical protein